MTIPEIHLGPIFADPTSRDLDETMAAGFADAGGILVTGFPGMAEIVFALPDSAKRRVATRAFEPGSRNIYRGFEPLPTNPHWAYNEIFDMGPEPSLPAPGLPSKVAFEEPNAWPDEADAPGWRAAMKWDLFAKLLRLSFRRRRGDWDRQTRPGRIERGTEWGLAALALSGGARPVRDDRAARRGG